MIFKNNEDRPLELLSGENLCGQLGGMIEDIKRAVIYDEYEIERLQKRQQDLLHKIEFQDLDVVSGYKAYKELQDVRIKRRILKDELRELEPLNDLIKKQSSFVELLPNAHAFCSRTKKNNEVQSYNPRTETIDDFNKLGAKYKTKLTKIKKDNNNSILIRRYKRKLEKLN